MTLHRVIYTSGITVNRTSPFMSIEDCKNEMERFNNLSLMDLERQAMSASIEDVEILK